MDYVIVYNEKITLPKKSPYETIFRFKLTLRDTAPPIWRRIEVPGSYAFYDLHVAFQNVMDWQDCHLHCFDIEDKREKRGFIRIECPWMEREYEGDDWLVTTEVPLKSFFDKGRDRALYCYDYGDGWEIEVGLEGIFPKEKGNKYPICLDGDLSGPPEDCGGTPGHYRCIDALINNDDSDGLLTWLGDWRPDNFDPNKVEFEDPRIHFEIGLQAE